MKRFKILGSLFILIVSLLVLSGNVIAGEVMYEISRGKVIHDPDSQNNRFIFRPEIDIFGESTYIVKATLSTEITPLTNDTTFLEIRIYPITTDWYGNNVSWTNPWNEPGGDFDELHYAHALVSLPQEQEVRFDLTNLLQGFCSGNLEYYGFIVTVSASSWDAFTLSNLHSNRPLATINVVYFQ